MHILGINAYHGDVSAVLVRDGELVAAVEEERFRRVKHWAGFPEESIRTVLRMGGITGSDVDHVAVSRNPRAHLARKIAYALRHRPSPGGMADRARNSRRVRGLESRVRDLLGAPRSGGPRFHFVEHHPAHLASSFFVSPFEDAAVCAIDGFGDFVSTSLGVGRDRRIDVLERVFFPHSLGVLYTAITQYLGFRQYGDEFKVMGLAPYGRPDHVAELAQLVELVPGGTFRLDLRYFRHWNERVHMVWEHGYPELGTLYSPALEDLLGPARLPEEPVTPRHEALARSLQEVYETACFHVLNHLHDRVRLPRLAFAGGSAMNSVANGKIRANTPFEEVYIQPAAGDNGTALGAAYWVWNQILAEPRGFVMNHGYWGPEHTASGVEAALQKSVEEGTELRWRRIADDGELCRTVAGMLAEGNIVGWYQGRMEWGARALGHRSILADPRRPDARDLINTKIKFREKFRPFAPSILVEHVREYFEDAVPDPFMIQVYPVREEKREVIPACTHVDGSGRLQTVEREASPLYWRLIREFAELTGVPVLLNTSFNENEPIVNLPAEAVDCFLRTRMDALVLGDLVVERVQESALASV